MADIPSPTRGKLVKIAKEGTKNILVWQGGTLRLFSCLAGGGGADALIEANQVNIS